MSSFGCFSQINASLDFSTLFTRSLLLLLHRVIIKKNMYKTSIHVVGFGVPPWALYVCTVVFNSDKNLEGDLTDIISKATCQNSMK